MNGGDERICNEDGADVADLNELSRRVEAVEYRTLGQERYAHGDVDDAAAYYQMSLDLFPTAEAHTYLGIALASRGEWDEAIAQCQLAIAIDPDLGNPYNDIGVYLIEQDRLDEALDYLDRAIAAKNYDCRHFPHYHRARILERKGRFTEARDSLIASVALEPNWQPPVVALHRVLGWLN